ncbi:hypothetical protein NDU88_006991 [Pleurodeles waltl]|uniref:Uncharacterized protein n=1 Tax=Pleurodeles waltl TaxID=8319 RepID=A0AAV7LWG1_PLEWA|nr:hypothetical protein NDU88_006991 [Pleurodeles waltl]
MRSPRAQDVYTSKWLIEDRECLMRNPRAPDVCTSKRLIEDTGCLMQSSRAQDVGTSKRLMREAARCGALVLRMYAQVNDSLKTEAA